MLAQKGFEGRRVNLTSAFGVVDARHPWDTGRYSLPALGRVALPRIIFHGLGHSHATQMPVQGVHMKVASEGPGHAGIGITMDHYSHVLAGAREEAVAKVDRALQAAVHSRPRST